MNTRAIDLEKLSIVLDAFDEFDQITQIIIQKWVIGMLEAPENAKKMKDWSYIKGCEYFCNVWTKGASEHVKSILQDFLDEERGLDKVINRVDDEEQGEQEGILPKELSTPKALEYFEKAKECGLIDDEYNWLKTKRLMACFCSKMNEKLRLGTGNRVNWKPFESLFRCKKYELRCLMRDVNFYGVHLKDIELVNRVFI